MGRKFQLRKKDSYVTKNLQTNAFVITDSLHMSSSQNCKIIKHVRLTAPENYFIMGKLCKSVKLTSNYLLEVVLSIRMTKYVFLKIPYHSIKLHWKTCDIHLKLSSKLSSSRYIISSTEKQLAERISLSYFQHRYHYFCLSFFQVRTHFLIWMLRWIHWKSRISLLRFLLCYQQ